MPPNEVLLAALAIGAIFLVVKSGDKQKKVVSDKRSADVEGGMTPSEARKANPTAAEDDDRTLWMNRLMEVEKEYASLVQWEKDNGAVLQQKRAFPVKEWHRIRVMRDRLVEMARVAKTIFDDKSHGADANFWDRFNGLWNGTQKFGETQQELLKSQPITAGSKSTPTHISNPAPGPADKMDLVLFNQNPKGVEVPTFTSAQLLMFNNANFNLIGQRQATLANVIAAGQERYVTDTNQSLDAPDPDDDRNIRPVYLGTFEERQIKELERQQAVEEVFQRSQVDKGWGTTGPILGVLAIVIALLNWNKAY